MPQWQWSALPSFQDFAVALAVDEKGARAVVSERLLLTQAPARAPDPG